jgi:hypothetical protein
MQKWYLLIWLLRQENMQRREEKGGHAPLEAFRHYIDTDLGDLFLERDKAARREMEGGLIGVRGL